MSNFPLYDTLIKDVSTKDLTVKQKEEFIELVEQLDTNGSEFVYLLIQYYFIKNDDGENTKSLPYNCYREPGDNKCEHLTWNFINFPVKLKNMLYTFVLMHTKQMKDDIERQVLCKI
jgi:hypothetical protein